MHSDLALHAAFAALRGRPEASPQDSEHTGGTMLEQKLCLHLLLGASLELSALARTNQQDIMQVLRPDVCRKGMLLCEKRLQNCLAVLKWHRTLHNRQADIESLPCAM